MNPTNCPSRTELDSFQAGDLDEPRLASLGSHVDGCSTCQRALETVIGDSVEPVLAALLRDPAASPFADEPACREAIERAAALSLALVDGATVNVAPVAATIHGGALKASDDLPVESIREYKLLAKLGEGGMGTVYKALHTRLDKVVALKILPADRVRDGGAVARFQREMKAVGRLDHPNIVRAMDAGEQGGLHFLVMEYVAGLDLSRLARNIGPLPIADACELVRQAALGLAEAHEHGMVHRDIKPSNLILAQAKKKTSQPTVKVLDLGLALLSEAMAPDHDGLTTSSQLMGTIDYMAPEQGGDSHQVDIRADIYSLGATLYHLLTGAAPFAGNKFDTPVKKLTALATQSPAPVKARRPEIPAPLAAIVERMLAKDPAARFATPEVLIEALAPYCQGTDLAALLDRAAGAPPLPLGESRGEGAPVAEFGTHANSSPSGDTAPTIDRAVGPLSRRDHAAQPRVVAGAKRKIPYPFAIALACGGAALALLLGIVLYIQTPDGTVRIEINDPKIKVVIDNDGNATFQGAVKHHKIVLKPGPHGLTITRDGFSFGTTSFELKQGEKPVLKIDFLAGKAQVTKDGTVLPSPALTTVSKSGWHGWPVHAPPPAIAPFDAAQAKKHQEDWAKYLGVQVEYTNSVGMKFRLIPPGEFTMGSTPEEIEEALRLTVNEEYWHACIKSEGPQHQVILTKPIYLGVYEVTQAEYERVLGTNPAFFAKTGSDQQWVDKVAGLDTASHPVEGVSWNDCAEFCAKLSADEKLQPFYSASDETVTLLAGNGYRMPTEAQWEFACRAGTTTRHWIGDTDEALLRAAWFNANSLERTHTVGELAANPFGLFDIQGNVWEWVEDGWSAPYYGRLQDQPAINPSVPPATSFMRAFRGGIWYSSATCSRAAFRHAHKPDHRARGIGFRVALPVEAVRESTAAGGYALQFGSDQSNVAFSTLRLDKKSPVTIEAYVTPGKTTSGWGTIFGTQRHGLVLDPSGKWSFIWGPAEVTGPVFTPDRRVHVAGVFDQSRLRLYVDGVQVGGKDLDLELTPGEASEFHTGNSGKFAGRIDQIRVSQVARYHQDFTAKANLEADADTLALYRFAEGQGEELKDSSGNNHHGKVVGAKWVRVPPNETPGDEAQRRVAEAIHLAFRWPADAPPPAIAPFDGVQAKAHQEAWAAYLGVPVDWENSLQMKFRLIPPGEFTMGSTAVEIDAALKVEGLNDDWKRNIRGEAPRHKVFLTQPLYLGIHEVTQAQYEQVMGHNPSQFAATGSSGKAVARLDTKALPVEMVSWSDAAEFCWKLSEKERLTSHYVRAGDAVTIVGGNGYRLPTEAQWEFACRAGTTTRFWSGDQVEPLAKCAWFGPNSGGITHTVGTLQANPFGLHDMLGNLWEWTEDRWEADAYAQFKTTPAIDPVGPNAQVPAAGDTWRYVRGGNWGGPAESSRAASRQSPFQNYKTGTIGFRVALPVEAVKAAIAGPADKPAPP